MSEFDPSSLRQPNDTNRPTGLEVFNTVGVYSEAGFPLFARDESDYDQVGGLRLEPYQRGDSPSRDRSEHPYNATWFEHLRQNYGGALKLLEGIRSAYVKEFATNRELDGKGVVDVYHMGVQLPNFLMWRGNNPVPNGEIPAETTVLRQALLGVGTVILHVDKEDLPSLDGKAIAEIAEKNGDLVGDKSIITNMPAMVCPASPEMIAGLAEALLVGNAKRGSSDLLDEYAIDVRKLNTFTRFVSLHAEREELFGAEVTALLQEQPVFSDSPLRNTKTKVQRYDEMVQDYGKFLDEHHPALYAALDRTDQPPKMNIRRVYKTRTEFLHGRLNVMKSDDPRNITQTDLDEFQSLARVESLQRLRH